MSVPYYTDTLSSGLTVRRSSIDSCEMHSSGCAVVRIFTHRIKVPLEFITRNNMIGVTYAEDESGSKIRLEVEADDDDRNASG